MKRKKMMLLVGILYIFAFSVSVNADEVVDSINEALEHYKNKDHKAASQNLDYASQLIGQKRAEWLQEGLPEPLKGWEAGEPKSETLTALFLGGGVSAECRYTKDSSSILIKYMADSPLMQSMMMLFANPAFVSAGGGKLERIGGEKAIVQYDPKSKKGKITVMVGTNVVVTLEGVFVEKDDIMQYAQKIDYKKLAAFK